MNYFFSATYQNFNSELQIPVFQNRNPKTKDINLYELYIDDKKWKIKEKNKNFLYDGFYLLNEYDLNNNNIFFLASSDDLKKFNSSKLEDLNDFTNTTPDFRANLKVKYKNQGFSSYQSEYPYELVIKKGTTLSKISPLCNKEAHENFLIFKNIFCLPVNNKFKGYFVNYDSKKIEFECELVTNHTNFIKIPNSIIKPEIFFVTKEFLGIPIYLALKNGHLSLEHSHPPHEYILGQNKFKKISELKKEFNEIIA